ncbi:ubiquitin-conjugating enzyme family protein (macronuclear) [Tetrahymena thermophila SB210]|uniref:Ubiquitin-conjugating enzyme family protein n=1 Tax=Tetrahymena thermophila (strain SB210) TaxID=312017 RepID=Q22MU6_TETTS|nr:ubiquitin-conjugating enzyme family protein [Tetrahymena thermophila SB210]EAR86356.1 ubiquitin-conjugating enzyme family protein [Tetrahymena thermophila SB210]|eukprot:XP_976924.1 ubiquitin-conjugating enzyme family protein [Tetrahymena thermophila SB210]
MNELFSNRQVGGGFTILRKLDIFGVPIQINFNYENKHTTKFGGIVSLAVFSLIFVFLINLLLQISNKNNPQVIQEQLVVDSPSRFDLSDQNFNFAIGLLDENFSPFFDESYYKIRGNFLFKQNYTYPNGTVTQEFQSQEIELVRCTAESFKVDGTQNFFLSQQYNNLYCIKDISKFYLVGQFDQPNFSVIQYFISQCSGSNCQNSTEIKRKLSISQLQIYYSNYAVKVSNLTQPFQPIGQSLFWQTNLLLGQVIDITYMNTYVTDDLGLISNSYVTKTNLLYSDNRVIFSSSASDYIYSISIYMEKNREQQYRRSYLKFTQAISQVGGIYNVLFLIGCLIAQPYSYLELQRKIVNSTFSFSGDYLTNNGNKNNKRKKSNKNKKKNLEAMQSNIACDGKSSNKSTNTQLNIQNFQDALKNKDYLQPDKDQKGNNTSRPVLDKTKDQEDLKYDIISSIYNEFKIRSIEYFKYYLKCFSCFKSDIQTILNFGTNKIYEFTDICFIVNKLIEVEKLKHLLLNDQQLKLFEYVPKPKITKSIISDYNQAKQNEKQLKKAIKQKQIVQLDIFENKPIQVQDPQQLNILTIMNKSQLDKARDAQQAFNYIYKHQKKLTKIDKKLILLLDEKHLPLFNSNSLENSIVGKYNSLMQININSQNQESIESQAKQNKNYENTLDQSQIRKSLYFFEQKNKNIEVIEETQKEEQNIQNSAPPLKQEDNLASSIALENISMSCYSYVNNIPQQLSVLAASPAFNIIEDFNFKTSNPQQYQETDREQ